MLGLWLFILCTGLLNFSEEMRQVHITSGRTIRAYLLVSFHRSEIRFHANYKRTSDNFSRTKTSRPEFLKAFHDSVELRLRLLADCALQGLKCKSLDEENFLCTACSHPVLHTYQNAKT